MMADTDKMGNGFLLTRIKWAAVACWDNLSRKAGGRDLSNDMR
jgi:hypothetical protein